MFFNSVYCTFKDSTNVDVDVNTVSGTPMFTAVDAGKDPSDLDRTVVSGALNHVSEGLYGYTLKPTQLDEGYYKLYFAGELQSTIPYVDLAVEGAVKVQSPSIQQDLLYRVRLKLKDVNTQLYRLDLPIQIWSDEEILEALQDSLDELNATPPMRTSWSFSALYSYGHGVRYYVVRAALASLLESKAIFEVAITTNLSDGAASLTMQRGSLYTSLANSIRSDINTKMTAWKRSLVPGLRGQRVMKYPYQLRRAISFLPGFKNIFS